MPEKSYTRIDSDFSSEGTRCAAWLYLQDGIERLPVIIMAHGFAGERTFALPAFAEKFVQEGFAVLLFDYRHFGASDGEPRNLVNPSSQCRDWGAALAHADKLENIDSQRIALWGTSLSGGHVIITAARHSEVKAVVAQMPYVAPNKELFKPDIFVRPVLAGIRDVARRITGRKPFLIPVVGEPGALALLNTPECMEGYQSIIPEDTQWENRIPARVVFTASLYNPLRLANRVQCPVLLVAARDDSLISCESVRKAASMMPNAVYEELPCNHFAPYSGEYFDKITQLEVDFLLNNL